MYFIKANSAGVSWPLTIAFYEDPGATQSNYQYQFWQHENHPILLDNAKMLEQRITYLHENPVRAGFVELPESWKYSSAVDYYTKDKKGLLEIVSVY